jgi:Flp pilus assembly protein TadD
LVSFLSISRLRTASAPRTLATAMALGLLLSAGSLRAQPAVTAAEIERQHRGGEPQLAQQRLRQALAQRPGDASLRFLQAVLLTESGQTALARSALERMTEEFPDLPEPYNNLAVLHAADGQLDRARTLLESALRLDPGYRVAHENLGDVFVRLALRAYEAAAGPRSGAPLQSKLALTRQLAALR